MKRLILLTLLITGVVSIASAQGYFLDRGQNGSFVTLGFTPDEGTNTFAGGIGFSANGVFDFGVVGSYLSGDEDDEPGSYGIGVQPFIGIHVLKPAATMPLGLSMRAGYQYTSLHSDLIERFDATVIAWIFTLESQLHASLDVSPTLRVRPHGGVTYFSTQLETRIDGDDLDSEAVNDTGVVLGVDLLFAGDGRVVSFGPEIILADGDRVIGFTLGVTLPR